MNRMTLPLLSGLLALSISFNTTAEWQTSPELEQALYKFYKKEVLNLMENRLVSKKEKHRLLFAETEQIVICVTMRDYLRNKYPDNRDFVSERRQLSTHLSMLIKALDWSNIAQKDQLKKRIEDDKPMLMHNIEGVYERNANSSHSSATKELWELASMCDSKISKVRIIEAEIK